MCIFCRSKYKTSWPVGDRRRAAGQLFFTRTSVIATCSTAHHLTLCDIRVETPVHSLFTCAIFAYRNHLYNFEYTACSFHQSRIQPIVCRHTIRASSSSLLCSTISIILRGLIGFNYRQSTATPRIDSYAEYEVYTHRIHCNEFFLGLLILVGFEMSSSFA